MAKRVRSLRKVPIADAISEAFGEIEALAQEMREWADNLEEKFSSTSKYETVSSSADTLEGYTDPDMPEGLPAMEVEFMDLPQRKRGYSRADRCGQACYILDQCIIVLEEQSEKLEGGEARDACESLRDDLENAKGDCEGVEFPGMYG
jgi:hypothetical protein